MKTFYVSLILSILLLVGGFLSPPLGIIDSSVLSAVGLLFAIRHSCPASPNACSHCPGPHLPPHQGRLDSRGDKQLWGNVTGKSNSIRLAP